MKRTTIFIVLIATSLNLFGKEIDILKYGADPTGKTLNNKIIQKAIDECFLSGGGKVVFPPGTYLSGTILLKDHVELHLTFGATLLASTEHDDFPRQPQPRYRSQYDIGGWYSLIYAEGATNIAITGFGTIDGQGALQKPRPHAKGGGTDGRPRNILFISCKHIVIKDITLKNSGIWNQHYLNSEDVLIDGIKVYNHSNRNNDGIDIDGCRRVILSNSIIDSEDDAICLKSTGPAPCEDIIINNCIASSFANGIKMGTESSGGFRNINISDCIVKPSVHPEKPTGNMNERGITGVSLEIVDGGTMEGVSVNNITIEGTNCPVYVRLGGRSRKYMEGIDTPEVGSMKNIIISNITAYNSGNYACSVTGIPGHNVENIQLNNFNITQIGGLKKGDYLQSMDMVDESIKGYPQPTVWKNLPVSGLFLRHVKNISVNGFMVQTIEKDPRPTIMADDVHQLRINNVIIGDNCSDGLPFVQRNVTKASINFD
jgi:polygalacturonase